MMTPHRRIAFQNYTKIMLVNSTIIVTITGLFSSLKMEKEQAIMNFETGTSECCAKSQQEHFARKVSDANVTNFVNFELFVKNSNRVFFPKFSKLAIIGIVELEICDNKKSTNTHQ